MVKYYITILLFYFLINSIYGQSPDLRERLTAEEIDWLRNNKNSIKFAPNPSWAPGDFVDEVGIHQGIVSDYIKIFETKLGVTFNYVYLPTWSAMIKGLEMSHVDIIGAIQKTEKRDSFLLFTKPYLFIPIVLLVQNEYPDIVDNNQIDGMRLANVSGYATVRYVRTKFPNAKIVECDDDLISLMKTSFGKTDGTVTDLLSASYNVSKYGINNLKLGAILDYQWELRVACRKELPILRSILDKALQSITPQEREAIYNKWVKIELIHSTGLFEKHYKLIVILSIGVVFFLLLLAFANRTLRREVRKRTIELHKELEEKNRAIQQSLKNEARLEVLFNISKRNTKSMSELFDIALFEAIKLTNSHMGKLYLFDSEKQSFQLSNRFENEFVESNSLLSGTILLSELEYCSDINISERDFFAVSCANCRKKCVLQSISIKYLLIIPIKEDNIIEAILFLGNQYREYEHIDAKQIVLLFRSVWQLIRKQRWQEQLVKAKEKAEESDRMKSAFLANLSHEIRTPMNGILGFLNILQNPELDENKRGDYISIVNKSSKRLLDTIHDIIEFSEIETSGKSLIIQKVNINDVLSRLNIMYMGWVIEKNIVLSINNELSDQNIIIATDEHKLTVILSCLLNNAIKFTDQGFIDIHIFLKDDSIIFEVKDTGRGIPHDKLDLIFDRFIQADMKITRAHEGTGLGLAIAKTYAGYLDGEIWVESVLGEGSKFSFSIPDTSISQTERVANKSETNFIPKDTQRTILIADDEKINNELVKTILLDNGYNVIIAENGEEALEIVKANPLISLVLMDIKMPIIDGIEATKQIREFNKTLPIIALSAHAFFGMIKEAVDVGCTDYVTKPFDMNYLLEKIKKYI